MSFRDGIIFKIASPHTEKIYIGFILAGNSRLLVLVKKEERRFVLVEVRGEYLLNTPNHKPFWSNWFRWKSEEQNQLAVYKYLMSIERSEEYLITSRPKTRYYRETIQKCLPPEIKWLEHFVCEEFPQTFCSKNSCLLYTSPSPRDQRGSRMPSSA